MILESVITCPHCATAKSETMPTDACWFFYECTGCGARLQPKEGHCCVFCSYGSVPCPPMQTAGPDEASAASCCTVNRLPNLTLDRRPILTLLSDGF